MNHTSEDSLTCAAWLPCGQRFVCGGSRGQFYYCVRSGRFLFQLAVDRMMDVFSRIRILMAMSSIVGKEFVSNVYM